MARFRDICRCPATSGSLQLTAQIAIVWQRATLDPLSSLDTRLPALGEDSDLFSPSAITRYGQWEASYEDDAMSTDAEGSGLGTRDAGSRAKVAKEWRIMMEQREKEVGHLRAASGLTGAEENRSCPGLAPRCSFENIAQTYSW